MASTSSEVTITSPADLPSLADTYSQISIVPISSTKRMISFAGQTGTSLSEANTAQFAPFAEQVRRALVNVDKCLAAVGASKATIVSNRQYVVELASRSKKDFDDRASIFMEWWRSTEGEHPPPPDTLLGIHSLYAKGVLFEIEIVCIADI